MRGRIGRVESIRQAEVPDAPALAELHLDVWDDGYTRAITFYERQGFRFDGQVQQCDEGPERRMVRPLNPARTGRRRNPGSRQGRAYGERDLVAT